MVDPEYAIIRSLTSKIYNHLFLLLNVTINNNLLKKTLHAF